MHGSHKGQGKNAAILIYSGIIEEFLIFSLTEQGLVDIIIKSSYRSAVTQPHKKGP